MSSRGIDEDEQTYDYRDIQSGDALRWVPPNDRDRVGDFRWDDDLTTAEMLEDIAEGGWEDIGIPDISTLNTLYRTETWQNLNDLQQVEVLQHYQDWIYETGSQNQSNTRYLNDEEWGLEIQRGGWEDSFQENLEFDMEKWFKVHANVPGELPWGGPQQGGNRNWIDFAYYADSNEFQAAKREAFDNNYQHMANYQGEDEIWEALDAINNWDEEDRESAFDWARENVNGFNDDDDGDDSELDLSYPTYKWDPNTNTMYRMKFNEENEPTGEYHTHLPPMPPEKLNIIHGQAAPEPSLDADGNRIVSGDDVTEFYRRYLNRTASQEEINYWTTGANENMSYQQVQNHIQNSPESRYGADGIPNSGDEPSDAGAIYYNPQEYGTEESLTAKMKPAPAPIQAPTITIRNIGEPTKPTHWYNALPEEWLTKAPTVGASNQSLANVDARHDAGGGLDYGHVAKVNKRVFAGDS